MINPEYESYISEAAETHDVDPELIRAVIDVESGGNTSAKSGKGATGLMQLMPSTAKAMGVKDLTDPRENILGGTKYLSKQLVATNGDVPLALARYNAGPGNVRKYGGIPPFKETQDYVKKVQDRYYRSGEDNMENPFGDLAEPTGEQVDQEPSQTDSFGIDNPFGDLAEPVPEAPQYTVPEQPDFVEQQEPKSSFLDPARRTLELMSSPKAVADTAATMVTSAYGLPLSGLMGLTDLATGGDLESANRNMQYMQDLLIHKPMSKEGQELTEIANYPMAAFQKLGEKADERLTEAGNPLAGVVAKTAIEGTPVVIGGALALSKVRATAPVEIMNEYSKTIKQGMDTGIKNRKAMPKTRNMLEAHYKHSENVVADIIKNAKEGKLELFDAENNAIKGPPKTVDQFSQAIEQGKTQIFDEMSKLLKQASETKQQRNLSYPIKEGESIVFDSKGKGVAVESSPMKVDLNKTAKALDEIANKESVKRFSPETIDYIEQRRGYLTERGGAITAMDAQESIQILNDSLKNYYKDPTVANKNKALVDAMIVNDLRKQLDSLVKNATGKELQPLKDLYGSYKEIEGAVNKKAYQIAKQDAKGLIDMSDIFTTHQVVKGIVSGSPGHVIGGAGGWAAKKLYKMAKDPNRKVRKMFEKSDNLLGRHLESKSMAPTKPYMPEEHPNKPISVNKTNMMIPIDEFQLPKAVKDILGSAKYEIQAKTGDLFRNKELWKETGFWLARDENGNAQWRYEVHPEKGAINTGAMAESYRTGQTKKLSEVLDYPQLFKAIPEAKNFKIKVDPTIGGDGSFKRDTNTIVLKDTFDSTSLWHELQHAINNTKKGPNGTNSRWEAFKAADNQLLELHKKAPVGSEYRVELTRKINKGRKNANNYNVDVDRMFADVINSAPTEYVQDIIQAKNKVKAIDPWHEYMANMGEVESRLTEQRMKMPPARRVNEAPWETQDKLLKSEGLFPEETVYGAPRNMPPVPENIVTELYTKYESGGFNPKQMKVFDELVRRGRIPKK